MSHVPLLARQTVPKLQSPRRGPQVVLLCLVATAVFLLVPQSAYPTLSWNATHAHEEPPPAVRRCSPRLAIWRNASLATAKIKKLATCV